MFVSIWTHIFFYKFLYFPSLGVIRHKKKAHWSQYTHIFRHSSILCQMSWSFRVVNAYDTTLSGWLFNTTVHRSSTTCWVESKEETCDWGEKWRKFDEIEDPEACSDWIAWVGKWSVKSPPETSLISWANCSIIIFFSFQTRIRFFSQCFHFVFP